MRGAKRIRHMFAAGVGLAVLLLLSGCNEGPWLFTSEQAREHLENRYPGEQIEMKAQGLNTWLCWFKDLPEATFHVEMVTRGGDPVPAYHNRLDSDAPDAVWSYYLDAYQRVGGSLEAWETGRGERSGKTFMELAYTSMAQVREAAAQMQSFFDWTEGRPHRELLGKGWYTFLISDLLPWNTSISDRIAVCTQGLEDSPDDVIGQCAGVLMEYYAFYNLPCGDFTAEELAQYAQEHWDWVTMSDCPQVWDGEEQLPGELFAGFAQITCASAMAGCTRCWPGCICRWRAPRNTFGSRAWTARNTNSPMTSTGRCAPGRTKPTLPGTSSATAIWWTEPADPRGL